MRGVDIKPEVCLLGVKQKIVEGALTDFGSSKGVLLDRYVMMRTRALLRGVVENLCQFTAYD